MFEVVLERAAEKDLRKLSEAVHDRVIESISGLARNPRPAGSKKLAGSKHDWRIRVGDFRVSMKSRTPFASCASIECGIAVKRIGEDRARLVIFVEGGIADMDRLRDILARHSLLAAWAKFENRFLQP